MAKTIVGLFDTIPQAQSVVDQLINAGIDRSNISLVSRNRDAAAATDATVDDSSSAAEAAGAGAIGGTVLGGTLGLLVGIGALAIPGIGPVLAAGPLAAALGSTALGAGIGAAAGGLIGALVGAGVPEEDAGMYAEGVRRGGTLVTVNAADDLADNAYAIMQQAGAADIDTKSANWRNEGWSRFDENAEPYATNDDDTGSKWEQSSKLGTAGGTVAGAATGAAVGSVAGPVGTVVGGIAGAVTGAGVGAAGDAAGEAAEDAAQGEGMHSGTRTRRGVYGGSTTSGSAMRRDTSDVGSELKSNYEESSKLGTAGGTVAGAATGAAAGSVAGPVGTVVGGIAGAVTGAGLGAGADAASEGLKDEVQGREPDTSRSSSTMGRDTSSSSSTMRRDTSDVGSELKSNYEESSKLGTAGGTVAGAATGAAAGSVAGPVGTVVGGIAGAAAGAGLGAGADAASEGLKDEVQGREPGTSREIGNRGWSDYERDFRSDYDTRFASTGTWDQYSTAYRYGYDVASDSRYQGRQWNDIETTLHGGWDEGRYGPCERFKDAVRHGWERTKDAVR